MDSIFLQILELSFTGSIVIFLILMFKKWLGEKLSPSFHTVVWVIALFILLVPIRVNFPTFHSNPTLPFSTDRVQLGWEFLEPFILPSISQSSPSTLTQKSNQWTIPIPLWSIWIVGTALFFLKQLGSTVWLSKKLSHHTFPPSATDILILNRLRDKLNIHGQIVLYRSSFIASPLISGLFRCHIFCQKPSKQRKKLNFPFCMK